MIDREAMPLVRLSPKKAPFRRANVHFPTLSPVVLAGEKLTGEQMLLLCEEPLVDVDVSMDDGDSWRRFEMPPEASLAARDRFTGDLGRPVTDRAHSAERAVDPTGPIVPRAPVERAGGPAAPPEAADPAVPIAEPSPVDGSPAPRRGRRHAAEVDGADQRPVADQAADGEPARG